MPGTLLHLTYAQEVYKHNSRFFNKHEFMCGNLIPDEASDKHLSHYRTPYGITGFFVPTLHQAKKELLQPTNSQKLGIFCHLYLDYHFIADFLIPKFIWDYDKMQVTNPLNKKTWTTQEFFAPTGLHSAYSEINNLLIQNHCIDMTFVNQLPTLLPLTGIAKFDNRREKNWHEELNEYLLHEVPYTGNLLEYDAVISFITKIAEQFWDEIL